MIYTLIYLSTAYEEMSAEALSQILTTSRKNNPDLSVTGVLLYSKGTFIQVLEGSEANVCALYERIKVDPRHYGHLTLMEFVTRKRSFPNWSMGFRQRNYNELDQEGFNRFFYDEIVSPIGIDSLIDSKILKLIKSFSQVNA